jgi:hypothetical protein
MATATAGTKKRKTRAPAPAPEGKQETAEVQQAEEERLVVRPALGVGTGDFFCTVEREGQTIPEAGRAQAAAAARQREAAWASLQDPWALLNASSETILAAAASTEQPALSAYPPGQVGDLLDMLEALRQLYAWGAGGAFFDAGGLRLDKEGRGNLGNFWVVEGHLGEILQRYYGAFRMAFGVSPKGYRRAWRRVVGWAGAVTEEELARTLAPNVFVALETPLDWLLSYLEYVTPSTVCVCENCGRIGPAHRADKRYCGVRCRKLASRKRLGS